MFRSLGKLQSLLLWMLLVVGVAHAQGGKALCEVWYNQSGYNVSDLDTSKPSDASLITSLDRPQNMADNYGTRIECLFVAPSDGDYVFYISGDSRAELWLSSDSSEASLAKIAYTPSYTAYQDTSAYPEQTSAAVTLQAGQSYYLRVLHKEANIGDHVSAFVSGPSLTKQVIGGTLISYPSETNAPTTPGSLAVTGKSDRTVRIEWQPSTDDTAVASYEILRDGVSLTTLGASQSTYCDVNVAASTTYLYTIKAVDVFGNESAVSAALSATTDAPVPDGSGSGLTSCFYNDHTSTTMVLRRVDPTVDFDWGTGSPAAEVNADIFCAQWDGFVMPRFTEEYSFSTLSDDGVRLYVDGKIVIDNWGLHAVTENSGKIMLEAGKKYAIRMEFFENYGHAVAKLSWESLGQPKEIIPQSQLFENPYVGTTGAELTTAESSLVSPVWVEGKVGTEVETLTATVGGTSFDATRMGPMNFYVSNSTGNPGVVLDPAAATNLTLTAGTTTLTQSIVWTPTLLNDGGTNTIRKNDSLLLGVSTTGTTVEIDVDYDSEVGFTVDYTGAATARFAHCFSTAGTFNVAARVDGTIVGQLALTVVGVDFQGPVACEIAYQRIKDIAITPVESSSSVVFEAADPYQLAVAFSEYRADGTRITIKPMLAGWGIGDVPRVDSYDKLVARLGEGGPAFALQQVDTFEMEPASSKFIGVVEQYEDGSMLVQTAMQMTKNIPDLTVDLHIFVSGVTFPDSTKDMTLNTSNFTLDAGLNLYTRPYQLIAQPGISTGTCHTIKIYQDGVQIGE